ncbi:MAG TPA: hypothetical protein VGX49_12030 [Jatrophihabitans sp.]|jgi:hypothetical protein|nr:hypothetical protein [Jatrophihabitans sp.]
MASGGKRLSAIIAATIVVLSAAGGIGYAQLRHSPARPAGIDFSQDEAANYSAAQLGMRLMAHLPRIPEYAGLRIVPYGVEVDVVGEPSARMRAAVARDAVMYQGSEIPVRFRSVRYTEKELQAVVDRVTADMKELDKVGIRLSSCGIDIKTNKVMIELAHYTDAYRTVLLARYGDRVTVYPHDVEYHND